MEIILPAFVPLFFLHTPRLRVLRIDVVAANGERKTENNQKIPFFGFVASLIFFCKKPYIFSRGREWRARRAPRGGRGATGAARKFFFKVRFSTYNSLKFDAPLLHERVDPTHISLVGRFSGCIKKPHVSQSSNVLYSVLTSF